MEHMGFLGYGGGRMRGIAWLWQTRLCDRNELSQAPRCTRLSLPDKSGFAITGGAVCSDRLARGRQAAVLMNGAISRDIASCGPYVNRRFGRTYHLHLQGQKSSTTLSRWVGFRP
jgi:hypothetical protein